MLRAANTYILALRRMAAGFVAAGAALLALTGCVAEDMPPCIDSPEQNIPEGMVRLSIRLVSGISTTADAGTRAWPDDYQLGSDKENRIDIENNDFRILLFDSKGNFVSVFHKELEGVANGDGLTMSTLQPTDPTYYSYVVKMDIPEEYIKANPQVQIMVLANLNSFSNGSENAYDDLVNALADGSVKTVEDVMNLKDKMIFDLAAFNDAYADAGDAETFHSNSWMSNWGSNDEQTSFIPMYGCKTFSLYTGVSSEYNRLELGDMYLLRSMAKIEVMDILNRDAGSSLPKVESVAIKGNYTSGRLIPYKQNYTHGQQVSAPSYTENPQKSEYYISLVPTTLDNGVRAWYGYFPESPLTVADAPVVGADITFINGENKEQTRLCTFNLKDASEWTSTAGNILRNHIYRLNIVGFSNSGTPGYVGIQYWTICPWVEYPDVTIPDFE